MANDQGNAKAGTGPDALARANKPIAANQAVLAEIKSRQLIRANLAASSELLFVVVPFIVIALALGHRGTLKTIFYIPEWSIVSSVILGQALMRVVALSIGETNIVKEGMVLLLTVLLVCGLIPSLTIVGFVLTSDVVSTKLAWTQAAMFLISGFVFWMAVSMENRVRIVKEKKPV